MCTCGPLQLLFPSQTSLISPLPAAVVSQNRLHQVAELVRGELVAFNIGHQLSPPIEDGSMQRVVHEPFTWEIVHFKMSATGPVRKCQVAGSAFQSWHNVRERRADRDAESKVTGL